MERLTKRLSNGAVIIPNITKRDFHVQSVWDKLAEYEDAEEQGLLLRLPCKVGDTVWDVDWFLTECIVKEFGFDEAGEVYCHYDSKDGIFSAKSYLEAFGSRLFLTKEEAEKKLAEMKEGAV